MVVRDGARKLLKLLRRKGIFGSVTLGIRWVRALWRGARLHVFLKRNVHKAVRRKNIRRYLDTHQVRKVQIGSGPNPLSGWLNTDLTPNKDVVFLDARERLPFDDCAVHYVFCEHLIEHLDYRDGVSLLRECFRVLKPGGRVRIATPDLGFIVSLQGHERSTENSRYVVWMCGQFFPSIEKHQNVFVMNIWFRQWGHQFIYDFEALRDALAGVGFVDIVRCNTGESSDSNLVNVERHGQQVPDEFNKMETFVAEGVKPENGAPP